MFDIDDLKIISILSENRNLSHAQIADRTGILKSQVQEKIEGKNLKDYAVQYCSFLEAKKADSLELAMKTLNFIMQFGDFDSQIKAAKAIQDLGIKKYPWRR